MSTSNTVDLHRRQVRTFHEEVPSRHHCIRRWHAQVMSEQRKHAKGDVEVKGRVNRNDVNCIGMEDGEARVVWTKRWARQVVRVIHSL